MAYTMSKERWKKFTPIERMGNIGSEYGRVLHFRDRSDRMLMESALKRTLKLIDVTVLLEDNLARKHELTLLKQAVIENIDQVMLQNYFNQFALLAMRRSKH